LFYVTTTFRLRILREFFSYLREEKIFVNYSI